METGDRGKFKWHMLELPDGITTSNGNWYHITRDGIENYIPGLLKKYPLEDVIKYSDAWLKSPGGLSLLLYFVLAMIGVNPQISAAISVVYYILWFLNLSSFVIPMLNPIVRIIQSDGFMYTIAAIVLIYFSFYNFEAMWIGIGLLFLFKVDLLGFGIRWFMNKRKSNETQKADRVLNMMLIKLGIKEGLLTKNIQQMEQDFLRVVNYNKKRKK